MHFSLLNLTFLLNFVMFFSAVLWTRNASPIHCDIEKKPSFFLANIFLLEVSFQHVSPEAQRKKMSVGWCLTSLTNWPAKLVKQSQLLLLHKQLSLFLVIGFLHWSRLHFVFASLHIFSLCVSFCG